MAALADPADLASSQAGGRPAMVIVMLPVPVLAVVSWPFEHEAEAAATRTAVKSAAGAVAPKPKYMYFMKYVVRQLPRNHHLILSSWAYIATIATLECRRVVAKW